MKMYQFKCYDCDDNKISVIEFEVEEKSKTYKVIGNPTGVYESIILKSDLDRLNGSYFNTMFSLSSSKSAYIKKLIGLNEYRVNMEQAQIENIRTTLKELKITRKNLCRLYEAALEEEGKK